jgi:DNA repair exonuclease SbcCD ATPase subunit
MTVTNLAEETREASRAAARKFRDELARVNNEITKCEVEMGSQTDPEALETLLARRVDLIRRKEVLPLMLRGARANALRAEAARLQVFVEEARKHADAAQVEYAEASAEFDEAAAALERASARLKEVERRRDGLEQEFMRIESEPRMALTDAHRAEQGMELLRPDRFDDAE